MAPKSARKNKRAVPKRMSHLLPNLEGKAELFRVPGAGGAARKGAPGFGYLL
jgi:hypothetical protein